MALKTYVKTVYQ